MAIPIIRGEPGEVYRNDSDRILWQKREPIGFGDVENFERQTGDWTLRKPIYMQRALDDAFQQLGKKHSIAVPRLSYYKPWSSQIDLDKEVDANIKMFTDAGINPQKEILDAQNTLTQRKLAKDAAAEGKAGRAIANREGTKRQIDRDVPPLLALGGGFAFSGTAAGMPLAQGQEGVTKALTGLLGQLISISNQQLDAQKQQNGLMAEANRKKAAQPIPPPLPVQGPGRISPR